jgi:hypothetical protein
MKKLPSIFACLCLLLQIHPVYAQKSLGVVKVEIKMVGANYQLMRDGKPYFVKGAGGHSYLSRLAAYGGNSIRTWGTKNAQTILDSAQKNGITVMMGLSMALERHHFDYDDPEAVKKQFERVKAEVLKYKDHPALLTWGIGNELNLHYKNPKVWDAINAVAKMIHEVDPNHPATTVLAGIEKREVEYIKTQCPDIDFLSVNVYGRLATLPEEVQRVGWTGAYMVAEWGPTGHWESLQTEWKTPVEESSSEKAAVYKSRYQYSIERDKNCLGSYVFYWGQKQERTPTWYGLFTSKGEETEVVDVMQFLWSGKWPANKAPHIYSFQIDQKKANNNIYLQPGKSYPVLAIVTDPNTDKLTYRYELLPEPTKLSEGGDFEETPKAIEKAFVKNNNQGRVTLKSPEKEGAYRLFVYATDQHNNIATANIPFYVRK